MENEEAEKQQPLVLSLVRFPFIPTFELQFLNKYRLLKVWDMSSIEERNIFLATHPHSLEVESLICVANVPVPLETLNCLPSLRCVLSLSAGVDHIDLIECRRRGIVVCNAGTVYSEDVADFAVGLLIDVLRKISSADRFVRARLWPLKGEYPLGSRLGGKRVGIVGLGSIGSCVAKRLETFGCIISYNSRNRKPHVPFPYYSNVLDLATNNDILIICCDLNEETFHIIDTKVMSALGKEGIIVNVGRGALIDEKELVRHLVEGEIGGVGLDVFENEPDVPSELLELDNVVLSPHKSLGGKRVGIIGLGSIGSKVAKRHERFGCIISLYNDVLMVCCELNEETFHIINRDVLSALGKNGVIINAGLKILFRWNVSVSPKSKIFIETC